MNQTLTIARRELTSLFFSPIAYVVLGIFSAGTAMLVFLQFGPNNPASLKTTMEGVIWLMIFLVPAISMRLLSEEFRNGTIEMLMTSPLTDTQIVCGKWLGAMGFFVTLLLPLLVLTVVLECFSDPDYGPIVTGLLGLILVGGFYLAIGTFASALSENQIITFLLTVFIICLFTLVLFFLPAASFITPGIRKTLFYLHVNSQFADFSKGLLDLTKFIYFISGTALFLFMAVKLLESKRWR